MAVEGTCPPILSEPRWCASVAGTQHDVEVLSQMLFRFGQILGRGGIDRESHPHVEVATEVNRFVAKHRKTEGRRLKPVLDRTIPHPQHPNKAIFRNSSGASIARICSLISFAMSTSSRAFEAVSCNF